MLKAKVFKLLDFDDQDSIWEYIIDWGIIVIIILNVIAVILGTVQSISTKYSLYFHIFEIVSVTVFGIEYILRLWSITCQEEYSCPITGRLKYMVTPIAIIDLAAIVPTFIPLIFGINMMSIKSIRLLRLLRILKLGRYSESLRSMGRILKNKKGELGITGMIIIVLLIFSSSVLYLCECQVQPEAFSSIPASMWWSVATLTTVGYGDIYPITPIGKFFAAVIALLGIGMVALPAGILASGFSEELDRKKEEQSCQNQICPHCKKSITSVKEE